MSNAITLPPPPPSDDGEPSAEDALQELEQRALEENFSELPLPTILFLLVHSIATLSQRNMLLETRLQSLEDQVLILQGKW